MLMLAVAAEGLLVVALATEVFDSLAGEEHNKENGDLTSGINDEASFPQLMRMKNVRGGFPGSRSDYSMFLRRKKGRKFISFAGGICADGQFSQS